MTHQNGIANKNEIKTFFNQTVTNISLIIEGMVRYHIRCSILLQIRIRKFNIHTQKVNNYLILEETQLIYNMT